MWLYLPLGQLKVLLVFRVNLTGVVYSFGDTLDRVTSVLSKDPRNANLIKKLNPIWGLDKEGEVVGVWQIGCSWTLVYARQSRNVQILFNAHCLTDKSDGRGDLEWSL